MATKKVTLTLEAAQLDRVRELVEAGKRPAPRDSYSPFETPLVRSLMMRRHGRPARETEAPHIPGGLMSGLTLDAGGLITLERNDRRIVVLLARAAQTSAPITVPASALAQAVRRPERQVRLARLVRQPTTTVVPLDRVVATDVGRLRAASGTSDIVDAHLIEI
jgi:hypothetical protein